MDDGEFERVRQDPDPIRRAKRSTAMIEVYMVRMAELSHLRKGAIEQANDAGMSYTEIAAAWGSPRAVSPRSALRHLRLRDLSPARSNGVFRVSFLV